MKSFTQSHPNSDTFRLYRNYNYEASVSPKRINGSNGFSTDSSPFFFAGNHLVPEPKSKDETWYRGVEERRRECEGINRSEGLLGEHHRYESAEEENRFDARRWVLEPAVITEELNVFCSLLFRRLKILFIASFDASTFAIEIIFSFKYL